MPCSTIVFYLGDSGTWAMSLLVGTCCYHPKRLYRICSFVSWEM